MTSDVHQFIATEEEMLGLGARLAHAIPSGAIIFLHGHLGAGKTTITRGLLRALGFVAKVKSPTYTLVEAYEVSDRNVFHFDLYRLNDPSELEFIGIRDYFMKNAICLVEWPEKGLGFLPQPDIVCHIEFEKHGRNVHLEATSERGSQMLAELEEAQ